ISIETSVHESKARDNWTVPVILTSSFKEQGIDTLWEKIIEHFKFLKDSEELKNRRFKQLHEEIQTLLEFKIKHYMENKLKESEMMDIIKKADAKEISSSQAVEDIFRRL
ncbi:MAG: hypothetical protein H7263_10900, partial [Candidatus Sericytochromatia bacterium]|nr:hypothetical protein [Candidatus Sericytochromatia bacterium]